MATKDFTTDQSMAFLLLLKEAGALPEWLDSAAEEQDVQQLPDIAFADTHRRLMPMHSKSAAFLSAVSAGVYDYPPGGGWENRLKAACHSYGIEELVKKAHNVLAPEEYHDKAAGETQKIAHALELIVEPGQPASYFYPINSRDEIETSALKLAADMRAEKLPGTWFVEAAENIVKAAAVHQLSETALPQTVRRLAEDRLPSPEYLTEQVERRVKQAGLPQVVADIYKEAASSALLGESSAMDAAHVWELADRQFGVRLTDTVTCPASAFRSGLTRSRFDKLAGEILPVAGINLPFNQLTTLPDELLAAVLPRKIASIALQAKTAADGRKAAAILQQLDEPEQLQLLELITESASA